MLRPEMEILLPFFRFLFQIGYFGPMVMGILDSSFLVLPFGNDLMVVALVARHPHGIPWYILSAACGSTLGALILAVTARKIGEEKLRKIVGDKRYEKLKDRIARRAGVAIAIADLAPPPFPFTTVIAAVGALGYPLWRLALINFVARAVRFTVLALLALRFGQAFTGIAKSGPFEWGMVVFIAACLVASGFSIWQWVRKPPSRKSASALA
jgi:membrane protein YqaA with SNARE-associated domain